MGKKAGLLFVVILIFLTGLNSLVSTAYDQAVSQEIKFQDQKIEVLDINQRVEAKVILDEPEAKPVKETNLNLVDVDDRNQVKLVSAISLDNEEDFVIERSVKQSEKPLEVVEPGEDEQIEDSKQHAKEKEVSRLEVAQASEILVNKGQIKNKELATIDETNDVPNLISEEPLEKKIKKEVVKKVEKKPSLLEQIKTHKVESGESLWSIARKHDINIDTLIGANNISNMNRIKPGQELKILPVKGLLYRVAPGDTLSSIAKRFDLSINKIVSDNVFKNGSNLQSGAELILRGAKPEFGYQDRLQQMFMMPTQGRLSSYYGPRWGRTHEGIDFAVNTGTPINAARAGRVVFAGWSNSYGYVVIIEHQKGLRTLYAHNSKLLVRSGEWVARGETISRSGNTGRSTGPHLHFEVQINGRPVNPLDYIRK